MPARMSEGSVASSSTGGKSGGCESWVGWENESRRSAPEPRGVGLESSGGCGGEATGASGERGVEERLDGALGPRTTALSGECGEYRVSNERTDVDGLGARVGGEASGDSRMLSGGSVSLLSQYKRQPASHGTETERKRTQ